MASLQSRLPQIAEALRPRVSAAVKAGAELVAQEARQRVPVQTGTLRDAIRAERTDAAQYTVIAGDKDAFYGHLVEFGTSRTAPRPFLTPAVEAKRDEVKNLVGEALKGL